jgi:hypothetical protein
MPGLGNGLRLKRATTKGKNTMQTSAPSATRQRLGDLARLTAAGLTVALWPGCSGPKSDTDMGSRYVKVVDVPSAQGASIVVTGRDSAELAGSRLDIPPGALAKDTSITLELQRQPLATDDGSKPAGPVAVWRPAGTLFAGGAKMTLPFQMPEGHTAGDIIVQILEENGNRLRLEGEALAVDANAGLVTFTVRGFTRFQVLGRRNGQPGTGGNGVGQPDGGSSEVGTSAGCSASSECSPGYSCVQGSCRGNADGGIGG